MGVANKIINIFVLIIAIASIYLAFRLFDKREKLTDGWKNLANTIQKTSRKLDNGTGTTKAKGLAGIDDHRNYKDLDSKLPTIITQATKVIEQRDDLSKTIERISRALDIKGFDSSEFMKTGSYTSKSKKILSKVENSRKRKKGLVEAIKDVAAKVDTSLKIDELDGDDYKTPIEKFGEKIDQVLETSSKYQEFAKEVAEALGFPAPESEKELSESLTSVKETKSTLDTKTKELETANSSLKEKQIIIDKKENIISKCKDEIDRQKARITKLENIINPPGGAKGVTAQAVEDTLAHLQNAKAKIVKVNKKWNFAVINIGSKYKVMQKIKGMEGKEKEIALPMEVNFELLVRRGNKYVARIKILRVYNNCSIVNIIDANPSTTIMPGDDVYFDLEAIRVLIKQRVEAAKEKKAELDIKLPKKAKKE